MSVERKIRLRVNGAERSTVSDPRRPLLDVLREDFGLTGTKYGCGEGQCRACTVLLDNVPTRSCVLPVSRAEGKRVLTIEGLADGARLHPVQQAFLSESAMQCGYCVPGMILVTVALLEKNPDPDQTSIVDALNGHLCRCCGYPNIVAAVRLAAQNARKSE
jgi:aerobic-type carbon monoxide dehydrogenase small subunit (CoxS/CutS family)